MELLQTGFQIQGNGQGQLFIGIGHKNLILQLIQHGLGPAFLAGTATVIGRGKAGNHGKSFINGKGEKFLGKLAHRGLAVEVGRYLGITLGGQGIGGGGEGPVKAQAHPQGIAQVRAHHRRVKALIPHSIHQAGPALPQKRLPTGGVTGFGDGALARRHRLGHFIEQGTDLGGRQGSHLNGLGHPVGHGNDPPHGFIVGGRLVFTAHEMIHGIGRGPVGPGIGTVVEIQHGTARIGVFHLDIIGVFPPAQLHPLFGSGHGVGNHLAVVLGIGGETRAFRIHQKIPCVGRGPGGQGRGQQGFHADGKGIAQKIALLRSELALDGIVQGRTMGLVAEIIVQLSGTGVCHGPEKDILGAGSDGGSALYIVIPARSMGAQQFIEHSQKEETFHTGSQIIVGIQGTHHRIHHIQGIRTHSLVLPQGVHKTAGGNLLHIHGQGTLEAARSAVRDHRTGFKLGRCGLLKGGGQGIGRPHHTGIFSDIPIVGRNQIQKGSANVHGAQGRGQGLAGQLKGGFHIGFRTQLSGLHLDHPPTIGQACQYQFEQGLSPFGPGLGQHGAVGQGPADGQGPPHHLGKGHGVPMGNRGISVGTGNQGNAVFIHQGGGQIFLGNQMGKRALPFTGEPSLAPCIIQHIHGIGKAEPKEEMAIRCLVQCFQKFRDQRPPLGRGHPGAFHHQVIENQMGHIGQHPRRIQQGHKIRS